MTLPELASFGSGVLALAQEAVPSGAPSRAASPEALSRGFRFLALAYTSIWVILAVYILSLSVRLRRLSSQVRRLKERLGA